MIDDPWARLTPVHDDGGRRIEGPPDGRLLASAQDTSRLVETCLGEHVQDILPYHPNLPPDFLDLSSGVAGEVLQRLRTYGIRLALVLPPGTAMSSRFGDMASEERRGGWLGIVPSRDAALEWLGAAPGHRAAPGA